jgi:hypothetical protein
MIGSILLPASSGSPRMSKVTSAECRSAESCGSPTFVTAGSADTRRATSSTAASKTGLPALSVELCTSTLSLSALSKFSSRISAMRPDSPGASPSPSCFVPTAPPSTTAITTNAIQPKVAVFQCAALHRPARAARLSLMACPFSLVCT